MIRLYFDLFIFFENRDKYIKIWVFDYLKTMVNILKANIRILHHHLFGCKFSLKGSKNGLMNYKYGKNLKKRELIC
jgi:hypothetical protein